MKDQSGYFGITIVMCGYTFVRQNAFKTWITNKHQFWHSALKGHAKSIKISRPYHCEMCGCTFAWHLAFKTWIPNAYYNHLWKTMEGQAKYLSCTIVNSCLDSKMSIKLTTTHLTVVWPRYLVWSFLAFQSKCQNWCVLGSQVFTAKCQAKV